MNPKIKNNIISLLLIFLSAALTSIKCSGQDFTEGDSIFHPDIWQSLKETTWFASDGFPSIMYVFYEDLHGRKKCIFQMGGSGLACIARSFVDFSFVGNDTIKIKGKDFFLEDTTLRAEGAAWRLYKRQAIVLNAFGILDMDFVRSDKFDVSNRWQEPQQDQ